jgi:ATP-dependent helicase/nuclease subunit A
MNVADELLYAFQRNVVIAASAGTGKTHRLSTLYVMLCLGLTSRGQRTPHTRSKAVAPARIVATTFSRGAALEIRTRIEESLHSLAVGTPSPPLAEAVAQRLSALGGEISQGEVATSASAALESFRDGRIDTLHGVAAELLRKNALALGLPPRFSIMEEDEEEAFSYGIIDELLSAALAGEGDEPMAARALIDLCSGFFRMRQEVLGFLNSLSDRGLRVASLDTVDHLTPALNLHQRLREVVAGCASTQARDSVREFAARLHVSLRADSPHELGAEAEHALSLLFAMRKPAKASPQELELFSFRDEIKGSAVNDKAGPMLIETLRQSRELGNVERALLALLGKIEARLRSEKLAAASFGFGDLLVLARDGLLENPGAALRARNDHDVLMVDEFQDTSSVQRDLVYLLRLADKHQRAAAGRVPYSHELESHGLFVVGDRKQSIYAFRGADVSVFEQVLTELGGDPAREALSIPTRGGPALADFIALRENYRSAPRIVDFVNAFTKLDFVQTSNSGGLGPGEELIAAREAPAGVVVSRMIAAEDDESGETDQASAAAAAARELLDGGLFEPRDIAILVRRRASIPFVELALEERNVPFTIAGRALFETFEARDLAALLHLVIDPRDRASLAHVLRGPLVGLTDEALATLVEGRGLRRDVLSEKGPSLPARRFPEEAARLKDFATQFRELRSAILRLPASTALRALLTAFDLDRLTAALPRPKERLGNMMRLIELSHARSESVLSFSRWLDRQIADQRDEAEAVVFSREDNAVRLVTIHASKGLDFPATILVDLGVIERPRSPALRLLAPETEGARYRFTARHRGRRGLPIDNAPLREDGQQRAKQSAGERTRLSYVALTRARDALVLIESSERATGSVAQKTLNFLKESESGAQLFDERLPKTDSPTARDAATAAPSVVPTMAKPQQRARSLAIATTPLGVFAGCPRRFRFRFQLGLEEPVDSGQLGLFEADPERHTPKVVAFEGDGEQADPRALGRAAHRYLELLPQAAFGSEQPPESIAKFLAREGVPEQDGAELTLLLQALVRSPYGQNLHAMKALYREYELASVIEPELGDGPRLTLRGTVDLCAETDDGLDIIDYKIAKPPTSLEAYTFQLRCYVTMARATFPSKPIRAGLLFLDRSLIDEQGQLAPPRWVVEGSEGDETFRRELAQLAQRLADFRGDDEWPGRELADCRKLHCGFVTACHRNQSGGPKRRRGPAQG